MGFNPFPSRGELLFVPRLSKEPSQREENSTFVDEIVGPDLRQFLLELRLQDVEHELTEAKQTIEALRCATTGGEKLNEREANRGTRLVSLIGRIREMSERLFPGPVTIDYASDPEDRTHEYVVFDVIAKGEYADYRDRMVQWHDEVEKIVPNNAGEFRVIVHPQP